MAPAATARHADRTGRARLGPARCAGAAVVEEVDLYRLECTRKLFVAAGMSDAEAKSRSLLLYACVFGLSLMHYAHFDDNLADLKQRIAERIVSS
jgi:hypothetical protein